MFFTNQIKQKAKEKYFSQNLAWFKYNKNEDFKTKKY